MNKLDVTKVFYNYLLVCNFQKSGLQIITTGQENVLHSFFTKSNNEVLTTSYTCTYLIL